MLRIGTRGSKLALWQATNVQQRLAGRGVDSTLVVIKTTGDMRTDVPLSAVGGKALFLKELEAALEERAIDLAVHSLKDVPSILDPAFELAAYVERSDPRDAWLSRSGTAWRDPAILHIGSSSPRRRAQLLAARRDLNITMLRGNVDTRIEKMRRGEFDGIVLAAAGLVRLERANEITSFFTHDEMLPSAGQGIIAVETLRDGKAREAVAILDDPAVRLVAEVERGVLQSFGTLLDCYSSVAVHAYIDVDNGALSAHAFFSDLEGLHVIRDHEEGAPSDAARVVGDLAEKLKLSGAEKLLESASASGGAYS